MKITLTGPDGVLGSNLVRELLKRGFEVKALIQKGKNSPTIDDLNITKIVGDILNDRDVNQAIQGSDYVIHCAAITSMWPYRCDRIKKVNVEGTRKVIESCLKHNIKRLIYIGTANSFASGTLDNPGNEKNNYEAAKYGVDYMDTKFEAQQLILKSVKTDGLDAVVINPTFMIGPHDSKPSSGQLILSLYKGKVPGYGVGGKNFVAVKDVAVAVANALTKGKKGECYIAGNENLSYKDAFEKIARNTGAKIINRKISPFMMKSFGKINSCLAQVFGYYPQLTTPLAQLASENHYYCSSKAQKELDMPQTSIDIAIRECFDWFKLNGYLK